VLGNDVHTPGVTPPPLVYPVSHPRHERSTHGVTLPSTVVAVLVGHPISSWRHQRRRSLGGATKMQSKDRPAQRERLSVRPAAGTSLDVRLRYVTSAGHSQTVSPDSHWHDP